MKEHPDDRKSRVESEMQVIKHGDAILSDKIDELKELMFIYSDEDAKNEFEDLRQWFWSVGLWEKRNGKK